MSWRKVGVYSVIATFALMLGAPQTALPLGTSGLKGNDLLSHCKAWVRLIDDPSHTDSAAPDDTVNGAHCVGYVAGIVDGSWEWQIDP
jgi:hypothetical protein